MVFPRKESGRSIAINFVTRCKWIDMEDLYGKCSNAFNYKIGNRARKKGEQRDVRRVESVRTTRRKK